MDFLHQMLPAVSITISCQLDSEYQHALTWFSQWLLSVTLQACLKKNIDVIYFLETDCFSSISPMPIKPFRFIHPSDFTCPCFSGFSGYTLGLSKKLDTVIDVMAGIKLCCLYEMLRQSGGAYFNTLLWAEPDQDTVRPWRL